MDNSHRAALKAAADNTKAAHAGASSLLYQLTEQGQLSPLQIQAAMLLVQGMQQEAERTWTDYMASFEGYGVEAEGQIVAPCLQARHRRYMRAQKRRGQAVGLSNYHRQFPEALLV